MKLTAKQTDFDFYLENADKFNFSGKHDVDIPQDTNGVSARESFKAYDTRGVIVPSRDAETVKKVINAKKSINMHIKLWAEGADDMCEPIYVYYNMIKGNKPEWIARALSNAFDKARYGFVLDRSEADMYNHLASITENDLR